MTFIATINELNNYYVKFTALTTSQLISHLIYGNVALTTYIVCVGHFINTQMIAYLFTYVTKITYNNI